MYFSLLAAFLNTNCNANRPGNVNPEFSACEPGCGCTFSYNGGAGAGTAACCCDSPKPYEEGFNDKKRDPTCCCEASRCYQRPLASKKTSDSCTSTFKYVPEFNYPPQPCPPEDSGCCPKPCDSGKALANCTTEFKYVPEFNYPPPPCPPQDSCCQTTYQCGLTNKKPCDVVKSCCDADSYELIANTDAQRYKGKGPDRRNFYADDDCCPCQKSNNASSNNSMIDEDTDWSEIRRLAYSAVDNCSGCSPKLSRRLPSFYCEEENYVGHASLESTKDR